MYWKRSSGWVERRDYAMVATLFYSGLRIGELAALRLSSVDLVARRLKVLRREV
jgi:integrase